MSILVRFLTNFTHAHVAALELLVSLSGRRATREMPISTWLCANVHGGSERRPRERRWLLGRSAGLDAVLIRRGRRARDKTSIFGSRAARPRTVMSADGTAAANWLRGGTKAITREYDALPTHYLSAPLAGVRTTCRDADDRTH